MQAKDYHTELTCSEFLGRNSRGNDEQRQALLCGAYGLSHLKDTCPRSLCTVGFEPVTFWMQVTETTTEPQCHANDDDVVDAFSQDGIALLMQKMYWRILVIIYRTVMAFSVC